MATLRTHRNRPWEPTVSRRHRLKAEPMLRNTATSRHRALESSIGTRYPMRHRLQTDIHTWALVVRPLPYKVCKTCKTCKGELGATWNTGTTMRSTHCQSPTLTTVRHGVLVPRHMGWGEERRIFQRAVLPTQQHRRRKALFSDTNNPDRQAHRHILILAKLCRTLSRPQ